MATGLLKVGAYGARLEIVTGLNFRTTEPTAVTVYFKAPAGADSWAQTGPSADVILVTDDNMDDYGVTDSDVDLLVQIEAGRFTPTGSKNYKLEVHDVSSGRHLISGVASFRVETTLMPES